MWTDLATNSQIKPGNATIKAYTTLGTEEPDTPTDPENPENPDEPSIPTDPENPEDPEEPDTPTDPETPEDPDEPGTSTDPEEQGKPVPSNFDNANSKITETKVYFDSKDLEKSTVEMTIKISGIEIGDETNTYKYYYHLSGTQGDKDITDWKETTIQKESDGTYSITLDIKSDELANIDEISESDNLYVYIREVAQVNGQEIENITTLETDTQIDPVYYVDGELIGGLEDFLGIYGNETTNNNNNGSVQQQKDNTVSTKTLPFAGNFTIKAIIILAIVAFGGFALYRYKNIDK